MSVLLKLHSDLRSDKCVRVSSLSESSTICPGQHLEPARIIIFFSEVLVSFKKYMPPPHLFHSKNICLLLTCFIQKIYAPSSSLLQGKHLPFSPSPLRLKYFRLFVILSLTQLYRYTLEIFLFSTATFKYIYRAPLRQIGQE
jgi:hypothetical protein